MALAHDRTDGTIALKERTAILLGAGGAARGAAFALAGAQVAQLVIVNRSLERAQLLAAEVQQTYSGPVFSLNDPQFLVPRPASLIVNATSVGMHDEQTPLPAEVLARFDADTFVYDMIYNPTQTQLLCQVSHNGNARREWPLHAAPSRRPRLYALDRQAAPLDVMRSKLF